METGTSGDLMDIDSIALVHPQEIELRPLFSGLMKPRKEVQERIAASMKKDGFDPSHPVHVWRQENCLVDGHQRFGVAKQLGIEVYAYYHDFADEDEALDYAIRNQRDRRNLSDAELVMLVEVLDKRKPRGGDQKSDAAIAAKSISSREEIDSVDTSASTAEAIGTSKTKVQKARAVLADPEVKAEVEAEKISLNQGAKKARAKKKAEKEAANPKPPGKSKVNGEIVDDPPDIAKLRAEGKIGQGVIPVVEGADDEDDGEGPEDIRQEIEERRAIKEDVGDDAWVESLPAYHDLEGRQRQLFVSEALKYRFLTQAMKSFKAKASEAGNKFYRVGPFTKWLKRVVTHPTPEQWVACPPPDKGGCGGTGSMKQMGACDVCKSFGFLCYEPR